MIHAVQKLQQVRKTIKIVKEEKRDMFVEEKKSNGEGEGAANG